MGKAIRASALILLLACSAQAGWMGNDSPAPTPSSEPTSAVQEPTAGGEIPTGEIPGDTTDTLTQIALDLLTALPSLL